QALPESVRGQRGDVVPQAGEHSRQSAHVGVEEAEPAGLDRRVEQEDGEDHQHSGQIGQSTEQVAPFAASAQSAPFRGLVGRLGTRGAPSAPSLGVDCCHQFWFAWLYVSSCEVISAADWSSTVCGSPPSYSASQTSESSDVALTPDSELRLFGSWPSASSWLFAEASAGISSIASMRTCSS